MFLDVTGRTAKRLLEMAGDADTFTLPVTQEELASMVGASRERVNKAIASFVRLGWLEQADRRYRIIDRVQLPVTNRKAVALRGPRHVTVADPRRTVVVEVGVVKRGTPRRAATRRRCHRRDGRRDGSWAKPWLAVGIDDDLDVGEFAQLLNLAAGAQGSCRRRSPVCAPRPPSQQVKRIVARRRPLLGRADHPVERHARSKRPVPAARNAFMPPWQNPITAVRS